MEVCARHEERGLDFVFLHIGGRGGSVYASIYTGGDRERKVSRGVGGFVVTYRQQIEERVSIFIRAVIESDGDVAIIPAVVDALSAVGHLAHFRPWDICRFRPTGFLVAIAPATVIELAVRRLAVFLALSAPTVLFTSFSQLSCHSRDLGEVVG